MSNPPNRTYLRIRELLVSDILREDEKPQLRQWIVNAKPEVALKGRWVPGIGLDEALVRVGRKVLIDKEIFLRWLEKDRDQRDFDREFRASRPEALTRLLKKRRR